MVTEPPQITPFAFSGEIDAGRDTQLVCYVEKGDSPLTIRWYFHGEEISHSMGVSTMKVGSRSSILSITSATHGHSGEYTCDAGNAAGKQRFSAALTVHGITMMDA